MPTVSQTLTFHETDIFCPRADHYYVPIALVTGQLSKEITDAGKEIEKLFGVLNEELLQLQ